MKELIIMVRDLPRRLFVALGLAAPAIASCETSDHTTPSPSATKAPRASFEQSWQRLATLRLVGTDSTPVIRERMPRYDDELGGVSFFRTEVADADLSNLTLPRTYFGKSEVRDVSFRNTDLTESSLCWNDFIRVDFSHATLAGADLRGSVYEAVRFEGADLRKADIRGLDLSGCTFAGANMTGAIVSRAQAAALPISVQQRGTLDERPDNGPEPDGG